MFEALSNQFSCRPLVSPSMGMVTLENLLRR